MPTCIEITIYNIPYHNITLGRMNECLIMLYTFSSTTVDASNNIITPAAGTNPPAVPMFDMMSGVQPTNSGPVQMMAPTLGGMGSVQTSPTMVNSFVTRYI